jgi:NAD(P)-dependent dehydrogenase (short-subunit alcohol dehydrogenase family)
MEQPVILITGATGGIGSAVAKALTTCPLIDSPKLMLSARNTDRLDALANELNAEALPADLTDPDAAALLVQTTINTLGRVDHVIHCVGSLLLKPAHLTSPTEWRHTLDTNLSSAFFILREACGAMRKTGGSITLFSSTAARTGLANHEAIAAAKAGLIGLALSTAATYAAQNIRVNCIAPGLVATPLTEKITTHATSLEASTKMHPLGRIGTAEEIAQTVCWLVSQSWVTGQVIGVDGGLATVRGRG